METTHYLPALGRTAADVIGARPAAGDRAWALLTGFHQLDALLGGLRPGQLLIVASRPGDGKSSFARGLAERVAVDQHQPTLLFSLETPAEDVVALMACARARVGVARQLAGRVDDAERLLLAQVSQRIARAPLFVDDSADLSTAHVRERARVARRDRAIELVIVDGVRLLQPPDFGFVAAQLKAMAMELKIPVVATAPVAGGIGETADAVVVLAREAAHGGMPSLCDVAVMKNRTGPSGAAHLAFLPEYARFENLPG